MSSDLPDDGLARLRAVAPGWFIWLGEHTGSWWAAPPAGHHQRALVSAGSPEELAEKIAAISQHEGDDQ